MAKFIKNKGLVSKIEDLIQESKEFLIIVCPYYRIPINQLQDLYDAGNRGVKIFLIYSKAELKPFEVNKLRLIKNLNVRYIENLHAKCYVNDTEAIISTMNLHEFSMEHNIEMGVLFGKKHDKDNYSKVEAEIQRIYRRSVPQSVDQLEEGIIPRLYNQLNPLIATTKALGYVEKKWSGRHYGYCIRTGQKVDFNIAKPLSSEAYREWAKYGNEDYPENYCHLTGEPSNGETTYYYPIMRKNWDKACRMYNL